MIILQSGLANVHRFLHTFISFCLVWISLSLNISAQSENRIDSLLASMTLEQKVGQMFMVNLYGDSLTFAGRDLLETWQPGAVVLFGSNITTPERIAGLTNSYQETMINAGGVPLFVAVDQEGGIIAHLREGFTIFPVPMLLTATANSELAFDVGTAMAHELRAVGVNMNLAPVADLNTNINNPIIGRRSPGTNPELVSMALAEVVQGMQSAGVMATVKHFPGHGDTGEDSHTQLPIVSNDRARLDAIELPPFIAAINADVGAVMVSHIWYTQLEPQPNTPASLSQSIVTGLLREELGYEGIIMTDALDMDAIDTVLSPEEASLAAIYAGNDLIAIGANVGEQMQARSMQAVVDAVRNGELAESRIDASVRRILEAKARFGVLDWSPLDTTQIDLNPPENAPLIETLFAQGITVLQDDENPLVPLDPTRTVGIVFPGNEIRVGQFCTAENVRLLAITDHPVQDEINAVVTLSTQVDTIVVFTRDAYYDDAQSSLVNALPPDRTIVVALQSIYDWLRFPDVAGYMMTYSPIAPASQIACEILLGERPAMGESAVDLSAFLYANPTP
ncbi:MAG: glycoside hydrolase family 3 protein [Aggregatilineales bacterium]